MTIRATVLADLGSVAALAMCVGLCVTGGSVLSNRRRQLAGRGRVDDDPGREKRRASETGALNER